MKEFPPFKFEIFFYEIHLTIESVLMSTAGLSALTTFVGLQFQIQAKSDHLAFTKVPDPVTIIGHWDT